MTAPVTPLTLADIETLRQLHPSHWTAEQAKALLPLAALGVQVMKERIQKVYDSIDVWRHDDDADVIELVCGIETELADLLRLLDEGARTP